MQDYLQQQKIIEFWASKLIDKNKNEGYAFL